jgi:hypothetical protein
VPVACCRLAENPRKDCWAQDGRDAPTVVGPVEGHRHCRAVLCLCHCREAVHLHCRGVVCLRHRREV